MNRIVIIGNGFDLAHGLDSRYEDFILSLINKSIEDLNKQNEESRLFEKLFSFKKNIQSKVDFENFEKLTVFQESEIVYRNHNYSFLGSRFVSETKNIPEDYFLFTINSKLFDDLLSKQNWTDIEKGYFEILSSIYKNHLEQTSNSIDLKKLNEDFEYLKELFIEYVKSINKEVKFFDNNLKYHFEKCFEENSIYDFYGSKRKREVLERFTIDNLESVIVVNFNYTNILETYVRNLINKPKIIPIHGQIYDPKSIVFGYGDEMTEYYKKLENLDDENVLKHFKSHYYHSNDNYAKLLFEVEKFEFDVVVFGHSLGLSDRLLLNTIFENENCKAIHLFHSGGESHFKKRIAISRHFDDKKAFRKKLMEENEYLKVERK